MIRTYYKSVPEGILLTYHNGMLHKTTIRSGDKVVFDVLRHHFELYEIELLPKFFIKTDRHGKS